MAEHTPGPWRANGSYVDTKNGMALEIAHVMQVGVGYAPRSPEESKFNARLIAAAPELLAALAPFAHFAEVYENKIVAEGQPARDSDIFYRLNSVMITLGDLRQARAALAKAKGGTQ